MMLYAVKSSLTLQKDLYEYANSKSHIYVNTQSYLKYPDPNIFFQVNAFIKKL